MLALLAYPCRLCPCLSNSFAITLALNTQMIKNPKHMLLVFWFIACACLIPIILKFHVMSLCLPHGPPAGGCRKAPPRVLPLPLIISNKINIVLVWGGRGAGLPVNGLVVG